MTNDATIPLLAIELNAIGYEINLNEPATEVSVNFYDTNKVTTFSFKLVVEDTDTYIDAFRDGDRFSCVSLPIDLDLVVDWAEQHMSTVR